MICKFHKLLLTLLLMAEVNFYLSDHTIASLSEKVSETEISWQELYEQKPPRKAPPAGSRGDICPIAPAGFPTKDVIWSDRPLFLWRGRIGKIEIRPRGSQQVFWSKTVSENDSYLMYDGAALQLGQIYDLVMFNQRSTAILRVTFEVMGGAERDRLIADLTRLETQLKKENATEEKIAYAKAEYFAARQMWADVFQQAYGVKNSSNNLTKFKENIPQRFCS